MLILLGEHMTENALILLIFHTYNLVSEGLFVSLHCPTWVLGFPVLCALWMLSLHYYEW